jgi:hypothetical protein
LVDVTTIGDEENHVIISLNDGVVVSHDDLIAANDATDTRAFRQHDFFDLLANDARASMISVDDRLKRFSRTAPQ